MTIYRQGSVYLAFQPSASDHTRCWIPDLKYTILAEHALCNAESAVIFISNSKTFRNLIFLYSEKVSQLSSTETQTLLQILHLTFTEVQGSTVFSSWAVISKKQYNSMSDSHRPNPCFTWGLKHSLFKVKILLFSLRGKPLIITTH